MYDYIIVGAGSAGCLLTNRLSADPANRVCLLEAGPSDRTYWIRNCNPLNMLLLMNSRTYNWGYRTEPEARTGNRPFFWPRGRALVGSSSVNAMIYTRGHPRDYDHWAAQGNPGWDYQSVLPWFRHSERQQRGADDWHGNQGTMAVVDANLRVHRVERLRVIDSSVMPTITGSNIHAPTVMIAEKGAYAILTAVH